MRKEWQSVDACVLFLTTDLNDDPSLKLALVERISKLPETSCMKCMCHKEMQRRLQIGFFVSLLCSYRYSSVQGLIPSSADITWAHFLTGFRIRIGLMRIRIRIQHFF